MQDAIYRDIPRIYTAIAEWGACMVYCLMIGWKVKPRRFAAYAIGVLAWLCLFLELTDHAANLLWIIWMLVAVFSMFWFLYLSCPVSVRAAAYCCMRAFLAAEFAASLEWQLDCYFERSGIRGGLFDAGLLILVYGVVFLVIWKLERPMMQGEFLLRLSGRELASEILIVLGAFAFSNLSFIYQNTPFSSQLTQDIFNSRTMVDLGGLAILYAFQSRVYELNAERELASINTMLKSQYDHYRHYQESIDMINMKYHDLKHQIAGLRGEMNNQKREDWLDTLENELTLYQADIQTGNPVLDTVLTGKMMYCRSHGITFTCVANGELMNFMHVTDLCTIFGNALDNAIESVSMVEDIQKRLIHMVVATEKGFVLIRVENYCEQELQMENHYPVTTKADKENHGIGLKSIRYSVEKYKGSMSFDVKKNWFELRILIPRMYGER